MKLCHLFAAGLLALIFLGCAQNQAPATPIDTIKTYAEALKKKDTAKMKSLLSKGSIKMVEEQAKAQNISVNDALLNETLFSSDQKVRKYKNEKIDGDNATIEIQNSFGEFDRIPFVKEDGQWKIAKEKIMDELQKQADEDEKRLNDEINRGREN